MNNRREFIKNTTLTGALLATGPLANASLPKSKKLKLLILGGTGFLGPHTINAALARGHSVTLFNRGKTNPELFAHLETITGDRNSDDVKQLAGRQWDAVIDTSAYFPRSVNLAMQQLKDNIKQYLLVSTISVYADWTKPGMDETAPVGKIDDESTEVIDGNSYGPLKALCEQAAERHMPAKVCTIRPGLIVGPLDKTDRFTYWPVRIQRGGNVLAPGSGDDFIQYIDVRDLAEWMVHCLEKQITGIFNAQTNGADITIKQLLNTCVQQLNPKTKLVWVPAEFLERHQVSPWQDMPTWFPPTGDFAGSGQMSSKRAYANGLQQRSMESVVNDCYQWFTGLSDERKNKLRAGISAEKEQQVLQAWQERQA